MAIGLLAVAVDADAPLIDLNWVHEQIEESRVAGCFVQVSNSRSPMIERIAYSFDERLIMGNLSSLRNSSSQSRSLTGSRNGIRHYVHAGIERIETTEYRDWKIKVSARQTGMTVRRALYTAFLEGPCAPFHQKIERQTSKIKAIAAAKGFIDRWYEENGDRWETEKRRKARRAHFNTFAE